MEIFDLIGDGKRGGMLFGETAALRLPLIASVGQWNSKRVTMEEAACYLLEGEACSVRGLLAERSQYQG